MEQMILCLAGVWFFTLGTVMGSFYNVLIDRLPNDQDIVSSRSHCVACHTTLRWYDLIPLLSFFLLRGRCRYCGVMLSWMYPVSELAVGGMFLLAYLLALPIFSAAAVFVRLALWSMLFVTGVMDFKYGIIIDQVLIPFTAAGAAVSLLSGAEAPAFAALGGAVGLAFYGSIYLLARLLYRREAFGTGDVFLLGAIGVFLGPWKTLLTGILAFYCCLLFLLFCRLAGRRLRRNLELPFGPSVCAAAFAVSLAGDSMLALVKNWLRL